MFFVESEMRRNIAWWWFGYFDKAKIGKVKFDFKNGVLTTDYVDKEGKKLNGMYTLLDPKLLTTGPEAEDFEVQQIRDTYMFKEGSVDKTLNGDNIPYLEGVKFEIEATPAIFDVSTVISRSVALKMVAEDKTNDIAKAIIYLSSVTRQDDGFSVNSKSDPRIDLKKTIGVIYTMPVVQEESYATKWAEGEDILFMLPTTSKIGRTTMLNFSRVLSERRVVNKRFVIEVEYEYNTTLSYEKNLKANEHSMIFDILDLEVKGKYEQPTKTINRINS